MIVSDKVDSIVYIPQAIRINFAVDSFFESGSAVTDLSCESMECRAREARDHFLRLAVIFESEGPHGYGLIEASKKLETLWRQRGTDFLQGGFERLVNWGALQRLEQAFAEVERHLFRQR
jgi:hypothetical protein